METPLPSALGDGGHYDNEEEEESSEEELIRKKREKWKLHQQNTHGGRVLEIFYELYLLTIKTKIVSLYLITWTTE